MIGENVTYVVPYDVVSSPQVALDKVCDFLEVDQMRLPERGWKAVNQATAPMFPKFIRQIERVSVQMHAMGLTSSVNLAKRLGLKSLYYGGSHLPALTHKQRRSLRTEFETDIQWLEQKLNRDFSAWQ